MTGICRWLPLSLVLHALALGATVWIVREVGEPALFVDMRLIESQAPPREQQGRPAAAPSVTRSAARGGSPRHGGVQAHTSARAAASAPAPAETPAPRRDTPAPPHEFVAPESLPSSPVAAAPSASAPAPIETSAAPSTPVTPPATTAQPGAAPSAAERVAPGPANGATPPADGAASLAGTGTGSVGTGGVEGGRGRAPAGSASSDGPLALAAGGDGGVGAYGPYLAGLRRRLHELLEYPIAARRRGVSGTVHLEVTLDATGRVSDVRLQQSSSHTVLDDAALQAARRLPRMPFPSDVRPRPLRVLMPVVFELR